MDSYRVEKRAAQSIQLTDADGEIAPVPTAGGGRLPEPELDRLSNILTTFNELYGDVEWADSDRIRKLITQDIPNKVAEDVAYQNARTNSDRQNARIEHDKALGRVIVSLMKDDTELFKQFSDNPDFKRWLTDTVFGLTYDDSQPAQAPTFKEHQLVRTKRALDGVAIPAGAVGVVVDVYGIGDAYEVEFDGAAALVLTLDRAALEAA
jgi:type I restriction enzyme R subunit